MNRLFCFLIIVFTGTSPAYSQILGWADICSGKDYEWGNALAVDNAGNVYVTGGFYGSVDFDPGPGNFTLLATGMYDIYLAKYRADGTFVWAKKMGSASWEEGYSVDTDPWGYVYVTGYYCGFTDFDPGPGAANIPCEGDADIFLARYDSSGTYDWAFGVGDQSGDRSYGVVADTAGGVYITGSYTDTCDFDPSPAVAQLISNDASTDIFIAKYDLLGNYQWVRGIGGWSRDVAQAITLDGANGVAITGLFQYSADFNGGLGTSMLYASGMTDAFVCKYNVSGGFMWAFPISGTDYEEGYAISVDSDQNIYVAGRYMGTVDFDGSSGVTEHTSNGHFDAFVSKYSYTGNFLKTISLGGIKIDQPNSIACDGRDVYLCGFYEGEGDYDPGPGTWNLPGVNSYEAFVMKLDSAMNMQWVTSITGTDEQRYQGCAPDGTGNLYATGFFENTVDLDPTSGTYSVTASGLQDMMLVKYTDGPLLIPSPANVSARLFPNPATGIVFVEFPETIETIQLFDAKGAIAMIVKNTSSFDTSHLVPGIYTVLVNGKPQGKLIVR